VAHLPEVHTKQSAADLAGAAMAQMADGLYVTDRAGLLVYMNGAGERMLGWTADELRGQSVHAAIHYQHADGSAFAEIDCALARLGAGQAPIRVADDALICRDGTILPVACSAAPLQRGAGPGEVVVVFRDTTEERAERAFAQREIDARSMATRTREALADGRMLLYAQQIVPLTGGKPALELLLRMLGPDGELISPAEFLPGAEQSGLIAEIDRWVVHEAMALCAGGRRIDANLSDDSVSSPELLAVIRDGLAQTGADPADLIFEITESALERDTATGLRFVNSLTELGCGIALDDFGTGFGSFTYLTPMPVRYLKIDVDFVVDLLEQPANQRLVKAIVDRARSFDQQTIAEGVEDEETLELLREFGVDFAQGFHIGRPAPRELVLT